MEGTITRISAFLRGLFLLGLVSVLTGCSTAPQQRTWAHAPGWSRGQLLGTTASTNLVPMVTDPDGNLYLAFISDQEPEALEFVSLDPSGAIRWDVRLPESPNDYGRHARLVFQDGELLAFWLDSSQVILQHISAEGEFISQPEPVTSDMEVDTYDVAALPDGGLVLWFGSDGDPGGLYALDLKDPAGAAVLIDPVGALPDAAVDEYGVTHVVWMTATTLVQDMQIRYQAFPPGYLRPADDPLIIETNFETTDELEPAMIALDRYYGYIFWTALIHTGLRAGAIDSFYLSFPLVDRTQQHQGQLLYTTAYELDYTKPDPPDGLHAGFRLPWSEANFGSDQIRDLATADSWSAETGVIFRPRTQTRSAQSQTQIGTYYFQAGAVESYQLLTFTNTASLHPNMYIDRQGYLFVNWLELTDVRQYSVYVATTSPTFQARFDRLTTDDYQRMIGDTAFGMVSGIVLIPVAFLWMIVPLASLALTSFLRRKETRMLAPGHLISLGIAIGLYWLIKLGIFPNLRTTVPFVQWIPVVPLGWYPWLRFIVPLLGTVIAVLASAWTLRRSERSSPVVAFLVYGLVDGLITVCIYGGELFGM